jgi:3alpha(or 20beta)-hydroxysteroid dehydrogenase
MPLLFTGACNDGENQMAGRVAGKVAIVTGGAMGMGAAHARLLAAEGARVVVADVADEAGRAVAAEHPETMLFARLDVTDADNWAQVVALAETTFGPVDVLVNNAGIIGMARIDEMVEADYRRVIDVNQIGPFLGIKAVVPSMRKAGGGSIVNIASAAGLAPLPHMASYVSSKYAVCGLSRTASIDLGPDNIRVNAVCPGGIATPMTAGAREPTRQAIPRNGRPEEVSAMVLFLASDEASYCTGAEYIVDGGFLNVVGEVVI